MKPLFLDHLQIVLISFCALTAQYKAFLNCKNNLVTKLHFAKGFCLGSTLWQDIAQSSITMQDFPQFQAVAARKLISNHINN